MLKNITYISAAAPKKKKTAKSPAVFTMRAELVTANGLAEIFLVEFLFTVFIGFTSIQDAKTVAAIMTYYTKYSLKK